MLAPIITKDMRLFPTQKIPVKNVRSRAQSLDHLQHLQSSSSTTDRLVPIKSKGSVSTGNISQQPLNSRKKTSALQSAPKSPPKSMLSRKSTLSAIQEGVELSDPPIHKKIVHSRSESSSVQTESSSKINFKQCGPNLEESGNSTDDEEESRKKLGVLKWITNTFRKSAREKVPDNRSTSSG